MASLEDRIADSVPEILVGVGLSVVVGRSLSTFLYAVNGRDPLILGSAALLLVVCCGLASFSPPVGRAEWIRWWR